MGTAVTLRNVVGEAQHAFVVAVVPLHGHFHTDFGAGNTAVGVGWTTADGMEGVGVQHFLVGVDEVHKTLHAPAPEKSSSRPSRSSFRRMRTPLFRNESSRRRLARIS